MESKNQCHYCQNKEQNTITELGGEIRDNSADIDIWCKSCGTLYTTHFDATGFSQANAEELKKKYGLTQQIKEVEDKKRVPNPEGKIQEVEIASKKHNKGIEAKP